MRRTIIKIEHEKGLPPDIEINGRQLTSLTERVLFYISLVLLALGAVWAIFYVLFPIIWFMLKLFFSILGIGFFILGLVLVVAIIFGLFKWRHGK
jgi:hypothetical protein